VKKWTFTVELFEYLTIVCPRIMQPPTFDIRRDLWEALRLYALKIVE
jgi:hypothetical protein